MSHRRVTRGAIGLYQVGRRDDERDSIGTEIFNGDVTELIST